VTVLEQTVVPRDLRDHAHRASAPLAILMFVVSEGLAVVDVLAQAYRMGNSA
jgi:hypothetical protein